MSPFIYQMVLRSVCAEIQKRYKKLWLINYYDDVFGMSQDLEHIKEHAANIKADFEELGFELNLDKCMLEPSDTCAWLGFNYSKEGVSLSDEARAELNARFDKFLMTHKVGDQIALLGHMQWCGSIFRPLLPEISQIQASVPGEDRCIKANHAKTLSKLKVEEFKKDVAQVMKILNKADYHWRPQVYDKTFHVYTDASKKFLGFYCTGRADPIQEAIPEDKKDFEIGHLETLAILRVLEHAPKQSNLVVHTDSANAFWSIYKCASASNNNAALIARIWEVAQEREVAFICVKVATDKNLADEASRVPLTRQSKWSSFFIENDSKTSKLTAFKYFRWLTNHLPKRPGHTDRRLAALFVSPRIAKDAYEVFMHDVAHGCDYLYFGHNAKLLARAYLLFMVSNPINKVDKATKALMLKTQHRLVDSGAIEPGMIKEAQRMKPAQIERMVMDFRPAQQMGNRGYNVKGARLSLGKPSVSSKELRQRGA